jgi:hypothetical protein
MFYTYNIYIMYPDTCVHVHLHVMYAYTVYMTYCTVHVYI